MAVYKNVENFRKLFDNEYKSTRKLINEGETHLDNLAEGFSEATRVIDLLPTVDVVPRSEIEQAKQEVAKQVIDEFKAMVIDYVQDKGLLLVAFKNAVAYAEAELEKKYIGE